MRRSITLFQRVRRVVELATGPDQMNPIHPTPALKKAWDEMRAELDTPEHKAWVKKITASPTFQADQKAVAEALGKALESAEENFKHSIY